MKLLNTVFYSLVSGILLPVGILWRLSKTLPNFFVGDNKIGINRTIHIHNPKIEPRSQILMKEIEMKKIHDKTSVSIIRVEPEP